MFIWDDTSRFARGIVRLAKGGKRNARTQFSQSTARPLPSNEPSKKRMDTIKRSSINHASRDTRYDIYQPLINTVKKPE